MFPPRISFHNNQYSVSLLGKLDHPEVPCHLSLCEGRLKSLLCKFQGCPEILFDYDKIIKDQLQAGIIETVEPDLMSEASDGPIAYPTIVWYAIAVKQQS